MTSYEPALADVYRVLADCKQSMSLWFVAEARTCIPCPARLGSRCRSTRIQESQGSAIRTRFNDDRYNNFLDCNYSNQVTKRAVEMDVDVNPQNSDQNYVIEKILEPLILFLMWFPL